jgi:hypothetical protein
MQLSSNNLKNEGTLLATLLRKCHWLFIAGRSVLFYMVKLFELPPQISNGWWEGQPYQCCLSKDSENCNVA